MHWQQPTRVNTAGVEGTTAAKRERHQANRARCCCSYGAAEALLPGINSESLQARVHEHSTSGLQAVAERVRLDMQRLLMVARSGRHSAPDVPLMTKREVGSRQHLLPTHTMLPSTPASLKNAKQDSVRPQLRCSPAAPGLHGLQRLGYMPQPECAPGMACTQPQQTLQHSPANCDIPQSWAAWTLHTVLLC